RSVINFSYYVSNEYLLFIPNIRYKSGYPGESAVNYVVSGPTTLLNKYDYIDKDRIGLQGQSWGGYQVAYIITETNLFAAASAGAPVTNMTSAYGGIRWKSGMSRMFQYEETQSRIGGTLWEKPLQYIENSPVFFAPKVNTPLLMRHNDNDGAVPWYQGIEYFTALRRLNKPVWLLNYNGGPHNEKAKSPNSVDLSIRMMQFFNHYLKGEPAPKWMTEGIPAVEKGETMKYELTK
ncbi:MAG: prolyl oligopeptidase family serine peptidase, partial [Salinivirgaceae bacterium]|nr:prolyl oligopeptidase family serine peptidase [Salinivirgaceae bacterium]